MKEIKGRKTLLTLGYISFGLAVLNIVATILMVVKGANQILENKFPIWLILGITAFAFFVLFIIASVWLLFVGYAIVATKGSIADDNLAKGTVNMKKCQKCGHKVEDDAMVCTNCGDSLSAVKKCPICGQENDKDAKYCKFCAKQF